MTSTHIHRTVLAGLRKIPARKRNWKTKKTKTEIPDAFREAASLKDKRKH